MERPNAWKNYDDEALAMLEAVSVRYRDFLDHGKTERECVTETVAAAKAAADNTTPTVNVLFKGEVLTIDTATYQTAKQHSWAASAWDKKGVATEYTCATCKTVAKVINSPVNAPAGSTIERIGNTLIAFTYTPGTANNTNTGSASSPKTFDAGIAMYVGMALTSVAGSAVVIGKKKEF